MTDINEIIGRAVVALDGSPESPPGMFLIDGYFKPDDIGAAVVKALSDHGYVIRARTREEATSTFSVENTERFQKLLAGKRIVASDNDAD